MTDIIKTWPAFMDQRKVRKIFGHFSTFFFTLGRGCPRRTIEGLWFTHQGRIMGRFVVREIVQNVGQLPKLRSIENRESEWQIKADAYVAICPGPFVPLKEGLFHESFRGWRYFNIDEYRETPDAKINMEVG